MEANALANRLLRQGDGLFDRAGFLRARLAADDDRLQRLVGGALPDLPGEMAAGGSMAVRRAPGRQRLVVHVSPVSVARLDLGARRPAVLVLAVDPARRPRLSSQRVSLALGLTPAEGRVAALLAEGRSVPDIAAEAGYQESYVRWLLKQAYRKHGVSGQPALVRLVLAAGALPRR
uniref:Putative LuxR-like transcriptional regulator n=1 Tax=Aplysina aerophoba bacterial symbiont clone pAE27P20 TaxID=377636 RepID=A4U8P5_9BACT|nr:putative LuxR-like transcriptional regulator [Aplysina aerophoba bacterial symbiont clone pAE27P20]